MLRIYYLQLWYPLSEPSAEKALYDIQSMQAFAGLELGHAGIPDETTILNFRHLLERHDLTKAIGGKGVFGRAGRAPSRWHDRGCNADRDGSFNEE